MVWLGILASGAYACSVFKGKLTADQPNGPNTATTSQTVYGRTTGGAFMQWCGWTPTATTYAPPEDLQVDGAPSSASIRLKLDPATSTDVCGASSNSTGTYLVDVKTGPMPPGGGSSSVHNCHTGAGTPIGIYSVTNGSGAAKNYTYSAPNEGGAHSICVYNPLNEDSIAINVLASCFTTCAPDPD